MKYKKLASKFISNIMLVSLIGVGVSRVDASTIVNDARHWDVNNGSLNLDSMAGGNYYVIQGKSIKDSTFSIDVLNKNVKIVLDNVDISTDDLIAPLTVGSGAIVNLELVGNNKIDGDLGIIVNQGGTLNIDGEGKLDITAESSAAIGNVMYDCYGMGDINIRGGEIYAKSHFGSAIGTSKGVNQLGDSTIGTIQITGGYVEAYGSPDSAGIGAGLEGQYGNICIGGDAVVKATGAFGGAGIGGGLEQNIDSISYGDIIITDEATVEAYSYYGAGIGSGKKEIDDTSIVNVEICGNASVYSESQWGEAIGNGVGKSNVVGTDIGLVDKLDNEGTVKKASKEENLSYKDNINNDDIIENAIDTLVKSVETSTSIYKTSENTKNSIDNKDKLEEINITTINNKNNIRLLDNSSVSCVSYYGDAIGTTVDSNIVVLKFKEVPLENTEIALASDNGYDIIVDVPSMSKSIATKLEPGEYVCDVLEEGVELDNINTDTFNPVVVSNKNEINSVKLVNATEVLPSVVYVDNSNGSNGNTGFSSDKAIRDFDKAYNRVASNGTIVVCNNVEVNTNLIKNKSIEITSKHDNVDYRDKGAELVLDFKDVVITDDIKLTGLNINMLDSNIDEKQILCLNASDTKFKKEINSTVINAMSISMSASNKVNIQYDSNNVNYIDNWSNTVKLLKANSLKSQILCMNNENKGTDN